MDRKTRLVPFDRRYLPFLSSLWQDARVTCMTGLPPGGIDMDAWYENYIEGKRRSKGGSEQFVILDEEGEPVGETAFGTLPKTFQFGSWVKDERRDAAMADIKIAYGLWGRGYGLDAFTQLVEHVFSHTGVMDIVTLPQDQNERALRLYARCGFVPAGGATAHKIQVYILSREAWGP